MDPGGRRHRDDHLRGDGDLDAVGGGPGQDDQGDGELHRQCRLPRGADQRGDGDRQGGEHPCDGQADDHGHDAGRADADGGHGTDIMDTDGLDQRHLHVPVDPGGH